MVVFAAAVADGVGGDCDADHDDAGDEAGGDPSGEVVGGWGVQV
jgi:hypothetical protein